MSSVSFRAGPKAAAATDRRFHTASGQATDYVDARAIRSAVLAGLTTTERALMRRWCIGAIAIYGGLLAVLLAIVLVAHASECRLRAACDSEVAISLIDFHDVVGTSSARTFAAHRDRGCC